LRGVAVRAERSRRLQCLAVRVWADRERQDPHYVRLRYSLSLTHTHTPLTHTHMHVYMYPKSQTLTPKPGAARPTLFSAPAYIYYICMKASERARENVCMYVYVCREQHGDHSPFHPPDHTYLYTHSLSLSLSLSLSGSNTGIIPRSILQILEAVEEQKENNWEYALEASFLEIYQVFPLRLSLQTLILKLNPEPKQLGVRAKGLIYIYTYV